MTDAVREKVDRLNRSTIPDEVPINAPEIIELQIVMPVDNPGDNITVTYQRRKRSVIAHIEIPLNYPDIQRVPWTDFLKLALANQRRQEKLPTIPNKT